MLLKPSRLQVLEVLRSDFRRRQAEKIEVTSRVLPVLYERKNKSTERVRAAVLAYCKKCATKLHRRMDVLQATLLREFGEEATRTEYIYVSDVVTAIQAGNTVTHRYSVTLTHGDTTINSFINVRITDAFAARVRNLCKKTDSIDREILVITKEINTMKSAVMDTGEELAKFLPDEATEHVDALRTMLQESIAKRAATEQS